MSNFLRILAAISCAQQRSSMPCFSGPCERQAQNSLAELDYLKKSLYYDETEGCMATLASLTRRTAQRLLAFLLALGVTIFLSAWSLDYWQAWVFLLIFSLSVTIITGYFLKTDPALIERRLSAGAAAEKEKNQKIIQAFANLFFLALIVFPGIDHRFGWSHLPPHLIFAGDGVSCTRRGDRLFRVRGK
jgi:hypothetical protein